MKVLVTGGAGYIGSQLVPALLNHGFEVRVIDNLTFGERGLQNYLNRIELIPIDIRDMVKAHFDDIEAVIHLAGLSNDPTAEFDPALNKSVNFDSSVRLAKLAKESGVNKFIFASSCSVYYSEKVDDLLKHESSIIAPKAAYSWSKYEAEKGILVLSDKLFNPVVLRQGTLFGYSERMRFDLVVNTFTLHAYLHKQLTLHAGGHMWRPLLDINDAVDIYIKVLLADNEKVGGQIFNVLNHNYQVLDIAKEVCEVLKDKVKIKLEFTAGKNIRSYRVCGKKLQEILNVDLKLSLRPSIEAMWNMIEKGGDFTDPIFYNICWFEKNLKQLKTR